MARDVSLKVKAECYVIIKILRVPVEALGELARHFDDQPGVTGVIS